MNPTNIRIADVCQFCKHRDSADQSRVWCALDGMGRPKYAVCDAFEMTEKGMLKRAYNDALKSAQEGVPV
jgi:hypothetical protein